MGDGGVAAAVRQADPGGIDAVARHQHVGRRHQVHRGDADGVADAAAVAHGLGQDVGVAQILHGPLHLSQPHQAADVGGTDGDAVDGDLRDDVAPQPQLGALGLEQLRAALVLVAEVVVVACHQVDGVIPLYQDLRDEILPGGGHHLLVKGDHDDVVDAVKVLCQPGPVLRGVDEGHRRAGDYLLGGLGEGEHRRADAPGLGLLRRAAQQGAVAQMYPVKKAQGNDSRLIGHTYAPKKFLIDVSVPHSARERQRKSPLRPWTR